MMQSAKPAILRRLIPIAFAALCAIAPASAQQPTLQQPPLPQQVVPPTFNGSPPAVMRRDDETAPAAYVSSTGASSPQPVAQAPQLLTLPNAEAAKNEPPPQTQAAPVGLTPPDAKTAKKLPLPGSNRNGDDKSGARSTSSGGIAGAFTVMASLGVVLALFLGMAWLMRRGLPKQGRMLPREAVESLGRIPFPGRQQGQLLRVGNKLVLVSFSSSGASVLAEITDPLEVDRLSGMCAQADRYSSVKSFRDVVEQFFGEKPARRDAARTAAAARIKERDVA